MTGNSIVPLVAVGRARDKALMANVSWFSKEEVIASLNNQHPELTVPGRMAIAHHLIKSWAEGEVQF